MLTADWLYCLLGDSECHISTQLKHYWQVSRTDGHFGQVCAQMVIGFRTLPSGGFTRQSIRPVYQTLVAALRPSKAFIMSLLGQSESVLCVCVGGGDYTQL